MDIPSNNRVMIVGGDSHFSYLMQRYVRTSAHPMISVNLGEDILSLARCEKPVVIILEVDRPETIGWHTLRALKNDPEVKNIPVIVCSWLDERERSLAEGAHCYLRMPILYADFDTALAATLVKEQDEKSA